MFNIQEMRDAAFRAAQWHSTRASLRGETDAVWLFVRWQLARMGLR